MMNDFKTKQNYPDLLNLLKLQRYKYSIASIISTIHFIISVVIPIGLSCIALLNIKDTLLVYFNFLGVVCEVICIFLPITINKYKSTAAQIQYVFDISLFGLRIDKLISNYSIVELVTESQKKRIQRLKGLENWYSIDDTLDTNNAIFSCQQQNIRWDKTLRKTFLTCMICVCSISIFAIISIAIIKDLAFNTLWSYIFLLLPIITYCIKFILSCKNDLKEQNYLSIIINSYSSKKTFTKKELEYLEAKIYYYRKDLIKIPNWFFSIFRKHQQKYADNYAKTESEQYTKKRKK